MAGSSELPCSYWGVVAELASRFGQLLPSNHSGLQICTVSSELDEAMRVPSGDPLSLTYFAPGTHKGPSTPNPAPCHYISPGPPPRSCVHRAVTWWWGGPLKCSGTGRCGVVRGPCGCQVPRDDGAPTCTPKTSGREIGRPRRIKHRIGMPAIGEDRIPPEEPLAEDATSQGDPPCCQPYDDCPSRNPMGRWPGHCQV